MRNLPLKGTFESVNSGNAQFGMFGTSALHALTPHFKTGRFHFATHNFDGFLFGYPKLKLNGIERCSVFPSHFDDSVYLLNRESIDFHDNKNRQ